MDIFQTIPRLPKTSLQDAQSVTLLTSLGLIFNRSSFKKIYVNVYKTSKICNRLQHQSLARLHPGVQDIL